MKHVMKKITGCIVTIALTAVLLWYSTDLFERKESDVKNAPFFEQEEDYDVLLFGTSHMGFGVYPMELWNDYGIVSYNLAGHGNPMATTYWTMVNAFDYKIPKLVVIDCYMLSCEFKTNTSTSSIHLSFDAFPLSRNKTVGICDLLDDAAAESREGLQDPRTRSEMLWDYTIYHSRWNDLGENDFKPAYSVEKGVERYAQIMPLEKMEPLSAEKLLEKETVSILYLRKMIETCQERGIDVLLTYLPTTADELNWQEANSVYDIAGQYGVDYINFLKEDVVNYATDYCDTNSHLNVSGARKMTTYLGQYIMEHYDIPDQRENTAYAGWHTDYQNYQNKLLNELRGLESLDNYLMMLSNENYMAVIEIHNAQIWENDVYCNLLANLHVDCGQTAGATGLLVIREAGKETEWSAQSFDTAQSVATMLGRLDWSEKEAQGYQVCRNGELFYEVTVENNPDADIRIIVLNKDTLEIVDHSYFTARFSR